MSRELDRIYFDYKMSVIADVSETYTKECIKIYSVVEQVETIELAKIGKEFDENKIKDILKSKEFILELFRYNTIKLTIG